LTQGRIEELLDDKADLEYELDVVERKVELLREEVRVAREACVGRRGVRGVCVREGA
jgi:hypothetical protein